MGRITHSVIHRYIAHFVCSVVNLNAVHWKLAKNKVNNFMGKATKFRISTSVIIPGKLFEFQFDSHLNHASALDRDR